MHPELVFLLLFTLTTIAAYGSFAAGEFVLGSGVLATVAAGMLCGNYGARTGMNPTTRAPAARQASATS